MFKKLGCKITKRDIDIMNILWDSSVTMTASDIIRANSELTMNTVQAVLRKLLKSNLIEVADIVYSGTVLSRSYKPVISAEDFAVSKISTDISEFKGDVPITSLVSAFLEMEPDEAKRVQEIQELEQLLNEYKNGAGK